MNVVFVYKFCDLLKNEKILNIVSILIIICYCVSSALTD